MKLNLDSIEISYELVMAMIDGKVCNAVTETTSTKRCYVCGATLSLMNIEEIFGRETDPSTFTFGLSPLNVWIRFFECLLHVSYRLDFKK